jgi:predicted nucleic acid-binding protein
VKVYLDTNVLVAAAVQEHQHHIQAFSLAKRIRDGAIEGFISTHGLAEFYSVLTRAPFTPRVHPAEAGRLIEDNILPYFNLIALSASDYKTVFRSCAASGLSGGMIFDALHLHSAQKAECDRVYTFDVKDFRILAPPGIVDRVVSP